MEKYKINNKYYYYKDSKFYNDHFEELSTKELEELEYAIGYYNNNSAQTENLCQQKEIINEKIRINNNVMYENDSPLELSKFDLTLDDIETYNNALEKTQQMQESIQTHNQNVQKQKDTYGMRAALISIIGFPVLCLLNAFLTNAEDIFPTIFLPCLLIIFSIFYYKIKTSELYTKSEIFLEDLIDPKLIYKINKFRKAQYEYDIEIKRTTKTFWDNQSGFEFEKEISSFLTDLGATTKLTPQIGDGGIDILMTYKNKKYAIQCKHHNVPVGPAPVRELRGVLNKEYSMGIFISLNGYTQSSKNENKTSINPILLLERYDLINLAKNKNLDEILNRAK